MRRTAQILFFSSLLCWAGGAGVGQAATGTSETPRIEEKKDSGSGTLGDELAERLKAEKRDQLPPRVPRPEFMRNKPWLPDVLLKDKQEGRYFTVMPAIGYDSDVGFSLGAWVELYQNGKKDDPFFHSTAYRQKILVGGLATTKDTAKGVVSLDQPYIFDSRWRLRSEVVLDWNAHMRYFGRGDAAMSDFTAPDGSTFVDYSDYKTHLQQIDANGTTNAMFDEYEQTLINASVWTEVDLVGGLVRPIIGFTLNHYWITDYTAKTVQGRDAAGNNADATQNETRLATECATGNLLGCGGGFDNFVRLGVVFDNRDFEPDPSEGILAQLITHLASEAFGSPGNYARITPSISGYLNLLPSLTRLVFAGRMVYSMQAGDVPFHSQSLYAFLDKDRRGLGGSQLLRGFKQDRFVGKSGILVNLELRWSFIDFSVLGQHLKLAAVPFFDTGRVFSSVSDFAFKDWAFGGGGGLRLAWNLSTIISFDYGVSREGGAFYMDVNMQF